MNAWQIWFTNLDTRLGAAPLVVHLDGRINTNSSSECHSAGGEQSTPPPPPPPPPLTPPGVVYRLIRFWEIHLLGKCTVHDGGICQNSCVGSSLVCSTFHRCAATTSQRVDSHGRSALFEPSEVTTVISPHERMLTFPTRFLCCRKRDKSNYIPWLMKRIWIIYV